MQDDGRFVGSDPPAIVVAAKKRTRNSTIFLPMGEPVGQLADKAPDECDHKNGRERQGRKYANDSDDDCGGPPRGEAAAHGNQQTGCQGPEGQGYVARGLPGTVGMDVLEQGGAGNEDAANGS